MGTVDKQGVVTMEELLVSSLATADALTKLLIEKGVITQAEFMQKLSVCRGGISALPVNVARIYQVIGRQGLDVKHLKRSLGLHQR